MIKYRIRGGDGVCVEVMEGSIRIYKEKLLGLTEKTVPFSQISGVEVQRPSMFGNSYLVFHIIGQDARKGLTPQINDNKIQIITSEEREKAFAIKQYIAEYNPTSNSNSPTSVSDEIRKLKQLLDEGIITQQEFNAKKKQLLNMALLS